MNPGLLVSGAADTGRSREYNWDREYDWLRLFVSVSRSDGGEVPQLGRHNFRVFAGPVLDTSHDSSTELLHGFEIHKAAEHRPGIYVIEVLFPPEYSWHMEGVAKVAAVAVEVGVNLAIMAAAKGPLKRVAAPSALAVAEEKPAAPKDQPSLPQLTAQAVMSIASAR
jgi:hypothetical protein